MIVRRATTGEWTVLAGNSRVLALRSVSAGMLDRILAASEESDDPARLLDELVRDGLSAAPQFALAELVGEGARLLVRGEVHVSAHGNEPVEVSGVGVATWIERLVDSVQTLAVAVGGEVWEVRRSATVAAAAAAPAPQPAPSAAEIAPDPAPDPSPEPSPEPSPVVEAVTAVLPELPPEPELDADDYLLGETVHRASLPDAQPESIGDHDGQTIVASDIAAMRASQSAPPPPFQQTTARYALALPDGRAQPIAGVLLVGRSPSAGQVSGNVIPTLVRVASDDQDISRTHVRFSLEGDSVVVTDLHSRNGTIVTVPGRQPVKLREGEPTVVLSGTVVDLGGGVTMTVVEDAAG